MDWYAREEMAETARRELDRLVESRRSTTTHARPTRELDRLVESRRSTVTHRRSLRFWLLATLRTWIISATR